MISVIIATKNRPESIRDCIASILLNSYAQYEIIVVDQSDNFHTKHTIRSFQSKRIKYIHHRDSGKTKAVNEGLKYARGSIVSFIDDDNIVESDWLFAIHAFLKSHKTVTGVMGTILPYKPKFHNGLWCPSTFVLDKNAFITNPYTIHHQVLGLGSNMSLRKSVLHSVGVFRPWLGPGAFGFSGGEDGDMIYRILRNGYRLAYDKRNIVYHNRWITEHQYRLLQTRYTAGEIAYMIFYNLSGDRKIVQNLRKTIHSRLFQQGIKQCIKKFFHKPSPNAFFRCLREFFYMLLEFISICKGGAVGIYSRYRSGILPINTR